MARVRHQVPGSITVSRQVRIADAFSNGATTKFALEQPANSIIESVLIRAVGDITIGAVVDINFNLGTNSDHTGNEVVTSVAYLDGSENQTVNCLEDSLLALATLRLELAKTKWKFTLLSDNFDD